MTRRRLVLGVLAVVALVLIVAGYPATFLTIAYVLAVCALVLDLAAEDLLGPPGGVGGDHG